ncbi:hypothetical protein E2C01_046712 [Portunus trituberculatus]|uniref:Uncharacterized protein n=1 Tax=Portunus trituberculatus TaxID=210409 RepID=A0A5B7G6F1_PORTR|nr:hypothetical protein [Portunus trituberculatus]
MVMRTPTHACDEGNPAPECCTSPRIIARNNTRLRDTFSSPKTICMTIPGTPQRPSRATPLPATPASSLRLLPTPYLC